MNAKSTFLNRWFANLNALVVAGFALAIGLLLPAGAHAATIVASASTDITLGTTWTGGSAPISGDANLWQTKGSGAGSALTWPGAPTSFTFNGQILEIVNGGTLNHSTAITTQYHINNVTLDAGGKLTHGANSAWNLAFDANGSANTLQLNGGTISLNLASTTDNLVLSKVNLNGSGTVTVTRTLVASGVIDFSAATVDTHLFTGIFSVTGGGQTGVTKFNLPAISDANESFELDITDGSSQWTNVNSIAVKTLKLWNNSSSALDTIAPGSYTASSLGANYSTCFSLPSDSTHTVQVGHSLTYDANGGTGAPASAWYNTAVTLSTGAGMTYASHAFTGWNTAAGGTGTAYVGGASATLSSNTTLYAQWTLLTGTITAPANFPAAISAVFGTASSPTSVTISSSGTLGNIIATAPTGLEVSSDGVTYGPTATNPAAGGTLYARLSASAAVGNYNSLTVGLSASGAASVNVATTASGNVVAATPYWTATSSGNWGAAGNWFAGVIASGGGVTADFNQVDITSDTTVHLDTSRTIGNLIFGNTDVSPAANWIVDNNGSSGNALTLAGGTPTLTVNNLGSGKSATISAELDGTNIIKAGVGTLILAPGTATDTLGSLKAAAGGLTLNSGTLNVTNTGTPAANGLWISGGTVTVAGGTLNANSGQVTINGGGTLLVTNGTCNANGLSMLNGYASAGTVTVSGTGLLNLFALRITQYTIAPGGVVNLNGGTLQLNSFTSSGATGIGTVNFNGTTVQAKSATTAFTYVTNNNNITYNVLVGGAIFDTTNYNITIGSPLVSGSSPDGGLTKLGSGTLTLSNANTYTGNTTINAGNLQGVVGGSCANSTVILNASTATNGVLVTENTQSWTCANLTAAAAGVLQFNFGVTPSTTVAPLVVTGAATFTATPTVTIVGTPPPGLGTYPLMTWGSKSGTAPSAVSVVTASGQVASLSNSPSTLYLVLATNPVASFPVVAAAPTNLIANGNFNQVANPVQISAATSFNINGSHGDYSAFWSNTCDLVSWSPFAADTFGLTTNVTAFVNDPTKILNGTYYLDTVVATNNGGITLNSSMSYLNGLIQTNVLNGVTVKSGATFLFLMDPNQAAGTANANSTFTAALTAGAGANATNPATAVAGSLFSVATTNLPTTAGAFLTNTISGASLLAAQGSGPVNVIFDQVNTTSIAGYPASPNPTNITQVAQVHIHNAILRLVVPTGDLNHDGVVDQADVNLAQSYLDGSIDGGASATNRENILINTFGFTTNQALAYLNLTAFDINGNGYFDASDVAALQALVVTPPPTLNYSLVAPNQIQFNWSGAFKLQWLTNTLNVGLQTNVSNGWVNYPNTNNPVIVTNHQTIPSAFFRLSQ